ncbi:chorismate--pyruvate lyase family protein [Motiliproteus sediminis]|uniref:chorismate--pyruvate lyase family protein n=1 Tax=Motiliproteus sediminis TaxID=1468178 RepID=UPI001AEFC7A2
MPVRQSLTASPLNTRWRSYRRVPSTRLPRRWRGWLLDPGSLTQRLVDKSAGCFRVELQFQGWAKPTLSEARALKLDPRQQALVREVRLIGCEQDWVYARSIIPASTLTGPQRKLRQLGNQSLGSLLFNDPRMRRGPIETTELQLPGLGQRACARRSVFLLGGKPLLVSEVFLPHLLRVQ